MTFQKKVRGGLKTLLRRKLDWELHMAHFNQGNYALENFFDFLKYLPLELQTFHALGI
jgi:hypothetical protein